MTIREILNHTSEKAGYYLGYIIGFLIIFAIGLVARWVTMEPYH